MADSPPAQPDLKELEGQIAQLQHGYEQYFLGLERRAPSEAHEVLKKQLLKIKSTYISNASTRFRSQTLQNRFLSYERLWLRTVQEIENGTYHRDIFKARLRAKAPATTPASVSPASVRKTPSPPAPPEVTAPDENLAEDRLRRVYEALIVAKKRCQEDTSKLTYEAVSSQLKRQVPDILRKANVKSVDLKVIIKDGKATLRVVPKS